MSALIQILIILAIIHTAYSLNTFVSNNDTLWQSTSAFIPIASQHNEYYGNIRLQPHMIMTLNVEWHGRVSVDDWETIFRLGWPATLGDCTHQNSRYPSLWIDNNNPAFHFSLSQQDSCGEGWQLTSYPISTFTTYAIYIEFTDTFINITINDTSVMRHTRTFPTDPSYIGQLLNVYIASDYWETPYVTADVSLWDITIISIPPTPSPTPDTIAPTINPSTSPTHSTQHPTAMPTFYPTIHPTINPTIIPTAYPSSNPTNIPTHNPSVTPTSNPTQNPSNSPTDYPTVTPITTDNPTLHPTANMSTADGINTTIGILNPSTDQTTLSTVTVTDTSHQGQTTATQMRSTDATEGTEGSTNAKNVVMRRDELLYLLIAGIVGCILCSLMIIIIVTNTNKIGSRKGKQKQKQKQDAKPVTFEQEPANNPNVPKPPPREISPSPIEISPSPNPRPSPREYVIKTEKRMEDYMGNDEGNEYKQALDDNELIEIQNGRDSESECIDEYEEYDENGITHNTIDHETECDEEYGESHEYKTGIDGMESIDDDNGNIDTGKPRKFLMSQQNEEEYIKRMMEQAVFVKPQLLNVMGKNSTLELVKIIDENDSVLSEDDTIKNLPVLPIPIASNTYTVNTVNTTNNSLADIDEESIVTMLEVGYEWITLVLLEIDHQNWRMYVNNFKQHQVTEDRLIHLTNEDLKQLIPQIGPRNLFEKLLKNKLGQYRD